MKKNLLGVSLLTLAGLYFLLSVVILGVCVFTDIPILLGLAVCAVIVLMSFVKNTR